MTKQYIQMRGIDWSGIASIFLIILSIYWDVWSNIEDWQQFILGVLLLLLFLTPVSKKIETIERPE